ncbi:unnamed protein product [Trichobilharzia regenti]|nr:unnamed protein product [Trichobilharzia regenti]
MNQTLTEERSSLEAHRRRLLNEISDERERLSLTASKQKEEMDTLRQNLELALTQANKQHKEEMQQLKADLNQRHKPSKVSEQPNVMSSSVDQVFLMKIATVISTLTHNNSFRPNKL